MRARAPLHLTIALSLLLLALQWHSGVHGVSYHLPIGKHADAVAQQSTGQPTSGHWLDVCDMCSVQLAASPPPLAVAALFHAYAFSLAQPSQRYAAFLVGVAQPRAPPIS